MKRSYRRLGAETLDDRTTKVARLVGGLNLVRQRLQGADGEGEQEAVLWTRELLVMRRDGSREGNFILSAESIRNDVVRTFDVTVLGDCKLAERLEPANQSATELFLCLEIRESLMISKDLEWSPYQVELEEKDGILDGE